MGLEMYFGSELVWNEHLLQERICSVTRIQDAGDCYHHQEGPHQDPQKRRSCLKENEQREQGGGRSEVKHEVEE